MELSKFDGFFGIFSALNLAWAGSKRFRASIDDQLLAPFTDADLEIRQKIERFNNVVSEVEIDEKYKQSIKSGVIILKKEFDKQLESIKNDSDRGLEFVFGYKSMFILTSLFCLTILIMGGFEQFYGAKKSSDMLVILNSCIFYNIFIFYRSFTKNFNTTLPIWKPTIFILLIIVVTVALSPRFPILDSRYHNMESQITIILAMLIAISPFMLHFIKVYIQNLISKQRISSLLDKFDIRLDRVLAGIN